MKRFYFTIICAVLSLSGCVTPPEGGVDGQTPGRTTLTAKMSQLQLTNEDVVLEGTLEHTWTKDMHIGAFGAEGGENAKYTLFNAYDNTAEGLFYGAEVKGNVYAYYPYSKDVTASGSKVALVLPDTQIYNADLVQQYEQNSKVMVAKSEDGALEFEHLYGCLAVEVVGDYNITKIKLTSDSEPLAGRVAVDFENNMQSSAIARSLYEVTLDCGTGVATTTEAPTKFYFLLPAATYTSLGLEVTTPEGTLSKKLMGIYTVNRVKSTALNESMSTTIIEADFAELKIAENEGTRLWEAGSEIGIFSENSMNTKYLMITEGGKANASFIGMESKGAVTAYYPYIEQAELAEGKLTLMASNTQKYNADMLAQFSANTPFMIAAAEEGAPLKFNYVMGVLGMRVSANMNIKYIEVTSSKALAGKLVIDTQNGYLCSPATSGSKHTITLDASNALPVVKLDEPMTFYVSLPVGEYDDLQITVTSDDGESLVKTIGEKITINPLNLATIADDITYQTIDVTLENTAYGKQAWTEGDEVKVYNELRGKMITSDILLAAGSLSNRVVTVGTPGEPCYLAYPASAVRNLNSVATIVYPSVQNYNDTKISTVSQIYVGKSVEGKSNMHLATSILAVTVVANYDCQVYGLKVQSKDRPLAGVADIDMNYEEEPTPVFTAAEYEISLVLPEPVAISNGGAETFYIAVPVGSYSASSLNIKLDASQGAAVVENAATIITSRAVESETEIQTIKCTNLTEGGKYANTFVMPNRKGWYMFDACAKGGYTVDEDGGALITDTAIAGTLFEVNSGMISKVNTCNGGKSVSFYYDGSVGNASIVTIDGGRVLWAWYLWCPGAGQPEDIVIGSNTYFDRSLGALDVPTSKAEMEAMNDEQMLRSGGMLFQWGRPSPFPYAIHNTTEAYANRLGQANANVPTFYYPSAGLITAGSYGAAATGGNVAKVYSTFRSEVSVLYTTNAAATKQPLLIGYEKNENNKRRYCEVWSGNVKHQDAPWNYSHEKNKQYDPCPYGYEVPETKLMTADYNAFYSVNVATAHLVDQPAGVFRGGYYVEHNGKFLWHAVAGVRYGYGLWGHLSSPNANIIGSTTDSNDHIRMWWSHNSTGSTAANINNNNWAPSLAAPVRCIKK